MMVFEFEAKLIAHNDSPGAWQYFVLPDDINDVIDALPRLPRNIIPVVGTLNSKSFSTSLMPFSVQTVPGKHSRFLVTNQKMRARLGLQLNQSYTLEISIDL